MLIQEFGRKTLSIVLAITHVLVVLLTFDSQVIDLEFLPFLVFLLKLIQLILSDRFVEVPQLVQLSLTFLEFGYFEFLLIPVLDLVV